MTATLASLFSLEGRVALVTGGTGGVGLMLARGLLMAGAGVLISGRNPQSGQAAVEALSEHGPCEFVRADLSTEEGIEALAAEVARRAPRLSVLVNNAGIGFRAAMGDYGAADFAAVLSVNVTAPFLLAQALHPLLADNASPRHPAHIINTGSIAGIATTSDSFVYGPSKAALHQLTRIMARRLGPDHIRVNAIAPGLFPSDMTSAVVEDEDRLRAIVANTPAGRIGHPDDLATLVVAMLCNGYLTGAVIPLDGGLSL